jgi:hypothetical protein
MTLAQAGTITVHHGALIDDDQRIFEIRDRARKMQYEITNISAVGALKGHPTQRLVDVARTRQDDNTRRRRDRWEDEGREIMGQDYIGSMILPT